MTYKKRGYIAANTFVDEILYTDTYSKMWLIKSWECFKYKMEIMILIVKKTNSICATFKHLSI